MDYQLPVLFIRTKVHLENRNSALDRIGSASHLLPQLINASTTPGASSDLSSNKIIESDSLMTR